MLALSINLARRHPVDCGCFGTVTTTARTDEERLGDMAWLILRDLGLLLLAAQVVAGAGRREADPGKSELRKGADLR
jgi:hypothetical protein